MGFLRVYSTANMPIEAQLSTCLDTVHVAYCDKKQQADTKFVKTTTAKVRLYNTKHKEAGVNENL